MKTSAIAACLLLAAVSMASASPAGPPTGIGTPSGLQNVAYRTCYYEDGVRYCRWVSDDDYDDYDDGYWPGPVFGFSFGGGPRFGGHGGHAWHRHL